MKTLIFRSIFLPLLPAATGVSAASPPNYVVTGFFRSPDAGDVYRVTDFNDQGMVCGTWKRLNENSVEVAGGVFVWQDGEMRKITPQQAGIAYVESPTSAQVSRVGGPTRMTNVRDDGTFLLAAPALQTKSTPYGVELVHRIIVYTLLGDLVGNPAPVVSGRQLGGFIRPNYYGTDLNYEDSSGVDDITEDGTVLGGPSTWNFNFPPQQIWYPYGGHAPRYFALEFRRTLGGVTAFDHDGRIIGAAADLNAPPVSFLWDAPLGGLTPTAAPGQTVWPSLSGFNGEQGDGTFLKGFPHAHGDFRAMSNNSGATAIWSNRYQTVQVIQKFSLHHNAEFLHRTRFTKSGHALGRDNAWIGNSEDSYGAGFALARRNPATGTYAVSRIADELAPSYELYPPFVNNAPVSDQTISPLAINANLDILGEYNSLDGIKYFYVLKNQPNGGKVRYEGATSSASEAGGRALVSLRRTLGSTGAASVRVTLGAGGTATAGADFIAGTSEVVRWNDGESGVKTASLPIRNDYVSDPSDTLNLSFSEATVATWEGAATSLLGIEDDDYPAPSIPVISGFPPGSGTVGVDFFYNASSWGGIWPPVWRATGLPQGLAIDPSSGQVSGKPKQSGTFEVAIFATNYAGTSDPYPLTLTIAPAANDAPIFVTSPSKATAIAGQPFSYQASSTGTGVTWTFYWLNPPPDYFEWLPPGFTGNATTGQLAGTFTSAHVGTVKMQVAWQRGFESGATLLEIAVAPSSGTFTALQRWLADQDRPFADTAGNPQLDSDGNGFGNLFELAFGLTPGISPVPQVSTSLFSTGAPVRGVPSMFLDSSSSPRMVVAVFRSKQAMALGTTYMVEFSTSLGQWDRAVSYNVVDSGIAGDIIHVADPNPGPFVGDPRFYRVGVVSP